MTIFNDPIIRIIKRLEEIEKRIGNLSTAFHTPYPVLNENTPAQLTANVDDYAPGDYASLLMSADAPRNISGISDGKKGRELKILNIGGFNLVFLNQSLLSVPANRIITTNGASVTLGTNDSCVLYYDSTTQRWRFLAITI